jgi:hypothetical protein
MHGDMVCLVTFDFIFRLVFAGMTRMSLIFRVVRMNSDNPAANMPSFRIPSNVIANFETFSHLIHLMCNTANRV